MSSGPRVLTPYSRIPATHVGHFRKCTINQGRVLKSVMDQRQTEPKANRRDSHRFPCILNWCALKPPVPRHTLPQSAQVSISAGWTAKLETGEASTDKKWTPSQRVSLASSTEQAYRGRMQPSHCSRYHVGLRIRRIPPSCRAKRDPDAVP